MSEQYAQEYNLSARRPHKANTGTIPIQYSQKLHHQQTPRQRKPNPFATKKFTTESGLRYDEEDQLDSKRLIKTAFIMIIVFIFGLYAISEIYKLMGLVIFSKTSDHVPVSRLTKVMVFVGLLCKLFGFGIFIKILYSQLIIKSEFAIDEDDLKKYN
ncbi:unnamed protein product [Ambrosiozyma monospora]|uniref:Unnamed protein product n=1 Tax=Ambrosiozyma monospora TaxID=43982 RepID=A0A9W6T2A0_AMBMO|nr:unnamed protein product [Ambrosiozyma monospora]